MARVFFSAGEPSGDSYAAAIATRLLAADHSIELAALGGQKLRALGVKLVADSTHWGLMGIVGALAVLPRVLRGYSAGKRELAKGKPGIFVPIDYGYLNVRLARKAKRKGWKVLYFIPPGSWRRDSQGADLPHITDEIVTPFPWSRDILAKMGASAHWFGHPLKELVGEIPASHEPRRGVALLPGSRKAEVSANLKVMAEAIQGLDGPITIALAPGIDQAEMEQEWNSVCDFLPDWSRNPHEALSRSMAGIVCSGTATLEAAICQCPCVVIYRGSKLLELEVAIRKPKFDFIALPNILLRRRLLPELIQDAATPERIRKEIAPLVVDSPERRHQLAGYVELAGMLGSDHAISDTADLILQMAQNQSKPVKS